MKFHFNFSLGEAESILEAAEEAALDNEVPLTPALLKQAADAYEGAADAAYTRQLERQFTNYWEGM